ncbi:MAG: hypothetical protein AAF493_19400 [Pseudomonadota bacterium]
MDRSDRARHESRYHGANALWASDASPATDPHRHPTLIGRMLIGQTCIGQTCIGRTFIGRTVIGPGVFEIGTVSIGSGLMGSV